MINKPPAFKMLDIRIPIIIPIKGRGLLIRGLGQGGCRGFHYNVRFRTSVGNSIA